MRARAGMNSMPTETRFGRIHFAKWREACRIPESVVKISASKVSCLERLPKSAEITCAMRSVFARIAVLSLARSARRSASEGGPSLRNAARWRSRIARISSGAAEPPRRSATLTTLMTSSRVRQGGPPRSCGALAAVRTLLPQARPTGGACLGRLQADVVGDDRFEVGIVGAQEPCLLDEVLRVAAVGETEDGDVGLVALAPHLHVQRRVGAAGEIDGEAVLEGDEEAHRLAAIRLVGGPRPMHRGDVANLDAADLVGVAGAGAEHLLQRHLAGLEPDIEHLERGDDLGAGGERDLVARADFVAVAVGDDDNVDLGEVGDLDRAVRVRDEGVGQDHLARRRGEAEDRPGEILERDRLLLRQRRRRPCRDDAAENGAEQAPRHWVPHLALPQKLDLLPRARVTVRPRAALR